jgi:hypothetical protein
MTLNIFYYEFLMAQSIARVDYKSLPSICQARNFSKYRVIPIFAVALVITTLTAKLRVV